MTREHRADFPMHTPAGPGTIDLEPYRQRAREEWSKDGPEPLDDICGLIAEVAALQERVDDLMKQNTMVRRRTGEASKAMADANENTEAAEARCAELAGALDKIAKHVEDLHDSEVITYASLKYAEEARTVLAATPEEVMERAKAKDQAYLERNHLVAVLARLYPSGTARTNIPGWSPDWHGCVYIDLPTGQVSYHYHDSHAHLFAGLPPYQGEWDGHDKETVHQRLARLDALKEGG